ncbi:MAG: hypothetical protein DMF04_05075 [Verrucomicrobia bacterium]|nr:MAG: hypothetical protein DMF04_05075 [Verrucomicrobiota bacterium]
MRLLCELFLLAVVVWLGWSQSFHDRVDRVRGIQPAPALQQRAREITAAAGTAGQTTTTAATTPTVPRQPFVPRYAPARPASTPSGDWMWDPAHRHPLDRPAYKSDNAQSTPNQSYWIDSRGVRHSVNSTPPPP